MRRRLSGVGLFYRYCLVHGLVASDPAAGVRDLGVDRGHQVLPVLRKGNRRATVPLTPATVAALHGYLDHRATHRP